jgi:hypothetical protein
MVAGFISCGIHKWHLSFVEVCYWDCCAVSIGQGAFHKHLHAVLNVVPLTLYCKALPWNMVEFGVGSCKRKVGLHEDISVGPCYVISILLRTVLRVRSIFVSCEDIATPFILQVKKMASFEELKQTAASSWLSLPPELWKICGFCVCYSPMLFCCTGLS